MSGCQCSSPPRRNTHLQRMRLSGVTGHLGNCRLKLKSSGITLKGTINQLNSGWEGRASLIFLCMRGLCMENLYWKVAAKNTSTVRFFYFFCRKLDSTRLSRCKRLRLDVWCFDWAVYGYSVFLLDVNRWKCWLGKKNCGLVYSGRI